MKIRALLLLLAALSGQAHGANYFVAPTGSNANDGSKDKPFATVDRGQTAAQPGDTVFLRGGIYDFDSPSSEKGIILYKNGAKDRLIHYVAFPGETPVFDFRNMTAAKRIQGVSVQADYIHLKGIEMKNVPQSAALKTHESWCLKVVGGNHNVFEALNAHHNMGPGVFVEEGGDNLFLNCDSHDNYDMYSFKEITDTDGKKKMVPAPGENADGFGVHVKDPIYTGNRFKGCRAWWNADDGWDFIDCHAAVTVDSCWTWGNGYQTGTSPALKAGNGNGFKVGGFGEEAERAPDWIPRHTVRFCLAFDNRGAGFYQNHHPVANFFYNNTAFDNKSSNFDVLSYKGGKVSLGVLRNNIAFMGKTLAFDTLGKALDAVNNSWNLPSLAITDEDFVNLDTAEAHGKRKSDGSLPDMGFMKLKKGSDLIDRGLDLALPHLGSLPDLGAFEYDATTKVIRETGPRARSKGAAVGPENGSRDLLGKVRRAGRAQVRFSRP